MFKENGKYIYIYYFKQVYFVSFVGGFLVGLLVDWYVLNIISILDVYLKNWLLDIGLFIEWVQFLCYQFLFILLGQ